MSGLSGPSPHMMNRGMHPPNGPQGPNPSQQQGPGPGQPGGGPGNASQLPYQALGGGRPPSRTATPGSGGGGPGQGQPGQGGMMQPSPGMAARQIGGGPGGPGGMGQGGGPGGMGGGGPGGMPQNQQDQAMTAVNNELMSIPPAQLNQLKMEAGLANKDFPSLNGQEKVGICSFCSGSVSVSFRRMDFVIARLL